MLFCFGLCGKARQQEHRAKKLAQKHKHEHHHSPIPVPIIVERPAQPTVPPPTFEVHIPQNLTVTSPTPAQPPVLITQKSDVHRASQIDRLRAVAFTFHQSVEQSVVWKTPIPASDLDLLSPIASDLGATLVSKSIADLRREIAESSDQRKESVTLETVRKSAELKSSIARFTEITA
jgi:hypothetical protein